MNTLDFLNGTSLVVDDFNANTNFIISDFLAEGLITLFYADGGNGKSWLGFAIAKHCTQLSKQVIYLDFDNPLSVLLKNAILMIY
ncbi:hypothetical protein [Abyssogena phaseoliformis symbiont]|uniref:hypothetical protein n=1 Tax=Abyssogena phaseoliformis symbiont TaxID=596095 RepID=UPI001914E71B|nr:hypothetical protein [Abyssogena phaseoliformis symbiont]